MTPHPRPWHTARTFLGPLITPIYSFIVDRRNRRFDLGISVRRVPLPVISIGNLTTGGTGKTPFTAWLARELIDRKLRPLIAMRGYKSSGGRSDEADEYTRLIPGVRVAVNPDRFAGIAAALAESPADCVLLDDGFQHRRLHRDLDIVLIDASRPLADERLFPSGELREPLINLRRAHAIVLTHAESADEAHLTRLRADIAAALGPRKGDPLVLTASHRWHTLSIGAESHDVSWLSGKKLLAACAIGNPGPFVEHVRSVGTLAGSFVRPDHDPFSESTVNQLIALARESRAEAIVTTEKDWSKLTRIDPARWPCPVVRPLLRLGIEQPDTLLERIVRLVQSRH